MQSKKEIEAEIKRLSEGILEGDKAANDFLKRSPNDLETIKESATRIIGLIRANSRLLSLLWVMEDVEFLKTTEKNISAADYEIEKVLDHLIRKC